MTEVDLLLGFPAWLFNSAEIQWSVNLAVEYITALTLQTDIDDIDVHVKKGPCSRF